MTSARQRDQPEPAILRQMDADVAVQLPLAPLDAAEMRVDRGGVVVLVGAPSRASGRRGRCRGRTRPARSAGGRSSASPSGPSRAGPSRARPARRTRSRSRASSPASSAPCRARHWRTAAASNSARWTCQAWVRALVQRLGEGEGAAAPGAVGDEFRAGLVHADAAAPPPARRAVRRCRGSAAAGSRRCGSGDGHPSRAARRAPGLGQQRGGGGAGRAAADDQDVGGEGKCPCSRNFPVPRSASRSFASRNQPNPCHRSERAGHVGCRAVLRPNRSAVRAARANDTSPAHSGTGIFLVIARQHPPRGYPSAEPMLSFHRIASAPEHQNGQNIKTGRHSRHA